MTLKKKRDKKNFHALPKYLECLTSEKCQLVDLSSKFSFSTKRLSGKAFGGRLGLGAIFQWPFHTLKPVYHFKHIIFLLADDKVLPGL